MEFDLSQRKREGRKRTGAVKGFPCARLVWLKTLSILIFGKACTRLQLFCCENKKKHGKFMTFKKCFYYNFIIALRSRQCEMELNGDRKSHRTMNVSLHISLSPASFKYIKDPESGGFMAGRVSCTNIVKCFGVRWTIKGWTLWAKFSEKIVNIFIAPREGTGWAERLNWLL